jgi:hypothetical protein
MARWLVHTVFLGAVAVWSEFSVRTLGSTSPGPDCTAICVGGGTKEKSAAATVDANNKNGRKQRRITGEMMVSEDVEAKVQVIKCKQVYQLKGKLSRSAGMIG